MQHSLYISDHKKKRKQRRKYLFITLAILVAYFLFFSFQWFVFHSPIFRVDSVIVTGNNSVPSADIKTLVEAAALPTHDTFPAIFSFNNMFLWPDHISPQELQLIPQLASVSISKDYFAHTVTIHVTERVPFGIWCFSSKPSVVSVVPDATCYWFDNTGDIFEHSLDTQGNIIFVVNDYSQNPRGLNQKVLSDEFVGNFISIMKVLRESALGIKEIDLNDLSLEEIDVVTANGPTIYFSLRFPADDYLSIIQNLMTQSNFDKLQYIDCRTEDRVYYK